MEEQLVKLGGSVTCPKCKTLQVTGLNLPEECPECLMKKTEPVAEVPCSVGFYFEHEEGRKTMIDVKEWINISAKLPPEGEDVMVWDKDDIEFARYYEKSGWSSLGETLRHVTHWMPKPGPPKKYND